MKAVAASRSGLLETPTSARTRYSYPQGNKPSVLLLRTTDSTKKGRLMDGWLWVAGGGNRLTEKSNALSEEIAMYVPPPTPTSLLSRSQISALLW